MLKGQLLVPPGREGQLQLGEPIGPQTLLERQGDRHVGPHDQALAIGQEAIDQPSEARGGGVKGGADGIGRHLLKLTGDDGREQGPGLICGIRLDRMPVLPSGLNDAATASPRDAAGILANSTCHIQSLPHISAPVERCLEGQCEVAMAV